MVLGPVPHMQTILAQNLRSGISNLGNRPLDEAKFGLQKAATEHKLRREAAGDARQAELDALARPGLEVNRQAHQNLLDQANAPVRLSTFMTDMNTSEHMMWTPQDNDAGGEAPERDPLIQKIATMYDASWDLDPESPTRGQMFRKDGTPVTMMDINQDAAPIKAFIAANSGMDHATRDSKEKLLRALQMGKINEGQYNQAIDMISKFENDTPKQIQYAQNQIDMLSKFTRAGNPLFNSEITEGIKRWERKRDGLIGKAEKQEERRWEKEKIRLEGDIKKDVAKIKADKTSSKDRAEAEQRIAQHLTANLRSKNIAVETSEDGTTIVAQVLGSQLEEVKKIAGVSNYSVYDRDTGEEIDMPGVSWPPSADNEKVYIVELVAPKKDGDVSTGGGQNTVNALIDKYLPQDDIVEPPKSEGLEVEGSREYGKRADGTPKKEGKSPFKQDDEPLTPEEARKRAELLRGKSVRPKIKFGKRKPGTPRP